MVVYRRGKKYKVFVKDLSKVIEIPKLAKEIPSFFGLNRTYPDIEADVEDNDSICQ